MMSFYLKYRPRTVSELDLTRVREGIEQILKSGNLAHAYLFLGPRGAGKTSTARILAKVINCQMKEELTEPCLKCEMCRMIETGNAIDVIEIDAASNRGIDNIRDLREKIGLAPVAGRKKVYIIDEVHMLSTEAFNALLKTLEEPPEHVVFVLCTTEEHKVPETVVSRCVRIQFTKADQMEMKRSLMKAIDGEKMKVSEAAVEMLASGVDGSFREGHKLLQELASLRQEIDVTRVRQILGIVAGANPEQLMALLLEGKTKEALEEIDRLSVLGIVWEAFAREVVQLLRLELRGVMGLNERKVFFDVRRIKLVLEKVAVACRDMKGAVIESLPLEILAVEMGVVEGEGHAVEEGIKKKPFEREIAKEASEVILIQPTETRVMSTEIGQEEGEEIRSIPTVTLANVSVELVNSEWEQIVNELKPMNHSVAGLLRSVRPKAVEDGTLVLEVFYKFHKDQLEQETKRRLLEEVVLRKVGLEKVRCVLGEKAQRAITTMHEHDNIGVVQEDEKLAEMVEEVFL